MSLLRVDSQATNAVKGARCGHAVKAEVPWRPSGKVPGKSGTTFELWRQVLALDLNLEFEYDIEIQLIQK